jgi:glycosyltransferase involved in cell wall biosynthesis
VGVKLSRNRGHQHALLAGLLSADGDAVISMDADLQDDLGVLEQMVDAWRAGHEIVYGVRRSRTEDTFFKRWTARRYYALLRVLGVDIVPDHAEFRLMGRKALEALAEYPEANLFLRGLIPQLGFRSAQVLYDRRLRLAGETKYPLRRMMGLGIDGITSFSAVPLRLIAATGAVLFVLSSLVALWVIAIRMFTDRAVPGWASITLPIYALGGVQLLSLGVVGEYVAKIYLEVKRRPRYIIERTTRDPAVVEARDNSQR